MSNFFDRFKPGAGDKNKNGSNPLAGWFQNVTGGGGAKTSSFSGQGQSLGGSAPGKVIAVTLSLPGPLGIQIEKSTRNTAIVARVVSDSQAEAAGLERGDILCFAGTNGTEEIMYDMFLQLAASTQRPLCFEVRRVPQTKVAKQLGSGGADMAVAGTSAEAFARKQAVIAAAEKRESAHKKLSKPLPKKDTSGLPKLASTAERLKLEEERRQRIEDDKAKVLSAATQAAQQQAKNAELATVNQLGYNPYESKSMTSGQARNAVTAVTHGSVGGPTNGASAPPPGGSGGMAPLPTVAPPRPIPAASEIEPSLEFQQAFETTVTSCTDHAVAVQSIAILRKLIVNATTKGQNTQDQDEATKFRKIRLANPKIRAAVTDMAGALDVLLSVGFQLHSENDESILVYPPGHAGPAWLSTALQQMDQYAQS
jgi:PUB domain